MSPFGHMFQMYCGWTNEKGSGSRTGGGSGLGLFVVRTILDKYGLKGSLSYHDGNFSVEISSR